FRPWSPSPPWRRWRRAGRSLPLLGRRWPRARQRGTQRRSGRRPIYPYSRSRCATLFSRGSTVNGICRPAPAPLPVPRRSEMRYREVARRPRMEIAVVTGTSTGIGFATSLRLARHGYRVFAGMRNLGKAEPLRAAAAEASLPIEVIPLDVTSTPSVQRAFETVAGHGPVDVLVNNAGIG